MIKAAPEFTTSPVMTALAARLLEMQAEDTNGWPDEVFAVHLATRDGLMHRMAQERARSPMDVGEKLRFYQREMGSVGETTEALALFDSVMRDVAEFTGDESLMEEHAHG